MLIWDLDLQARTVKFAGRSFIIWSAVPPPSVHTEVLLTSFSMGCCCCLAWSLLRFHKCKDGQHEVSSLGNTAVFYIFQRFISSDNTSLVAVLYGCCVFPTIVVDRHTSQISGSLQHELRGGKISFKIATSRKITCCLGCWGEIENLPKAWHV